MRRSSIKPNPESQRAWKERARQKAIAKQRENPKQVKPLRFATPKRAKQNREYSQKRKVHLEANPYCVRCSMKAMQNPACDVHHSKGRTGDLLTDETLFVSLCRPCHDWTEANFREAEKLGLSVSRHTKRENSNV